jgi:hypothetical protein
MSAKQPELQGLNMVVLGSFNPQIYQPAWLARQKLIQDEEAEKASIQAISNDIAVFSIGWMGLEATAERLSFSTNQPQYYELLRDLVVGVFRLLRHTPVTNLGINWMYHFKKPTVEKWHEIGHLLTPKDVWNKILKKPGMLHIRIEGVREDSHKGKIHVAVEPSVKVQPGIYVLVNDQFELHPEKEGPSSADLLVEALSSEFKNSMDRATGISQQINDL